MMNRIVLRYFRGEVRDLGGKLPPRAPEDKTLFNEEQPEVLVSSVLNGEKEIDIITSCSLFIF